ncbi:putative Peroxiredoxin-2E-2, chloroplastic [Cardiosporidium cionae]|uniref:Peroxiredoxin-2E-2, chloroplastic n=1 Tax=Cardiosporidium cionae TaxID=476202 RepID=A0ABQ7J7U5_9APIC|nr:putative Peroxiredoxin-2E-2, chloroplastic [Cardiosporidium cionae]|eukprot:KAF8820063.1 putative Peroxiredoxin-2E-2, chloroplastic [Cardiosporidium cionae]
MALFSFLPSFPLLVDIDFHQWKKQILPAIFSKPDIDNNECLAQAWNTVSGGMPETKKTFIDRMHPLNFLAPKFGSKQDKMGKDIAQCSYSTKQQTNGNIRGSIHDLSSQNPFSINPNYIKRERTSLSIVCLSVRSALDLFLQAVALPEGSEILIGAINIPDIVTIIEKHHLVPVPVDIEIDTLAIKLDELPRLLTTKTRAILVAHLFGAINSLNAIIHFAKMKKLLVIEDCAECFSGSEYSGHPQSDMVAFSFGVIKTNTACGGAIANIKDNTIAEKMTKIQAEYPQMPITKYLWKLTIGLLACFVQSRIATKLFLFGNLKLGIDYKPCFLRLIRGFNTTEKSLQKFRYRPNPLLEKILRIRLENWDMKPFQKQMRQLRVFTDKIRKANVVVPGHAATYRNFWLYPVLAAKGSSSKDTVLKFQELGIDAAVSSSQISLIMPPKSFPIAANAHKLMEKILYLPVHRRSTVHQMVCVVESCRRVYEEIPSFISEKAIISKTDVQQQVIASAEPSQFLNTSEEILPN